MEAVREITISDDVCTSIEGLHAYLASSLDLPEHYGANLSAFADCLSEISRPVIITISVEETLNESMDDYLIRFTQVCAREALSNPALSLIIE